MQYVSTRGSAPSLDFEGVTLAGLASDGGLYVPAIWPKFSAQQIAALNGASYVDTAVAVMTPFVGDSLSQAELRDLCTHAYGRFSHSAVTPLVQIEPGTWVLELFHGPTLAFKDVAMQLLARMMDHVLEKRGAAGGAVAGKSARATIVGATSGDTGGAAIEAFRGSKRVDVIILFPDGRVSDVQRDRKSTRLNSSHG